MICLKDYLLNKIALVSCLMLTTLPYPGLVAQEGMPTGFITDIEEETTERPTTGTEKTEKGEKIGADEPREQEAPLLGKEEIPFWHDTRLSTAGFFLANVNKVQQTIPAGYGLLLGFEAMPVAAWYPELHLELGFLNFSQNPNSVMGANSALGLMWLVPLKSLLSGTVGTLQLAVLPGMAWLRIEDRIEIISALKFQLQGILGYEVDVAPKVAAFLQARYSYLYDPAVPFHSVGVSGGVSYHFRAKLRKTTQR